MAIAIIRTIILFITIVVSMRIMGKRQLGELEPAELVVAVLISDLAAHPLQDPGTPLLYGLIPVLTLLCCEILISAIILKSVKLRGIICGRPSIIIKNGVIDQKEMKKNRFTADELMEELRKKDILDIASVKYAILETDGTLSTILCGESSPVTQGQMNITADEPGYPVIIINNGRILRENLRISGHDHLWLEKQLKKRKVNDASSVYLMSVDEQDRIFFAPMEAL